MIRKVIIDTNVLVSALLSSHEDSATVRILGMTLEGLLLPVVTEGILREYGEVLGRRKFRFPEEMVSDLLLELKNKSLIISPPHSSMEIPDEKDRPFLDAMLCEKEAILVTGNLKHFPQHDRILSARSFIALHCGEY